MPRGVAANKARPLIRSRSRAARWMEGCDSPTSRAARLKLPAIASAESARNCATVSSRSKRAKPPAALRGSLPSAAWAPRARWSSARWARSRNSAPASVGAMPLAPCSRSRTPSVAFSRASAWVMAGCDRWISRPAWLTLAQSATVTKARRWRRLGTSDHIGGQSIAKSYGQGRLRTGAAGAGGADSPAQQAPQRGRKTREGRISRMSGKTALVISAHAADFVWRCGGAIALHRRQGL